MASSITFRCPDCLREFPVEEYNDSISEAKAAAERHRENECGGGPDDELLADGGTIDPSGRWGPHQCPYGPQYEWWRTNDGMFVAGHHVVAVCGYCGGEMHLADLVDGQAFLFQCPVCTHLEQTPGDNDETVERPVPLEIHPVGPLALDDWTVVARGREAETEVLDDAIRAVIDVEAGPDAFMLRSPTLFEGGVRSDA